MSLKWFCIAWTKLVLLLGVGIPSIISLRNGIIRNVVFQRSFK
jgi:hypothetical protein